MRRLVLGDDVRLHTSLVVKEDSWQLFGFVSVFEKRLFEKLLTANGVGPSLAKRMVADRDSNGAFGQFEGLCSVKGIGPALAAKLRPLVTFTGARRPLSAACGDASKGTPKTRRLRARQPR